MGPWNERQWTRMSSNQPACNSMSGRQPAGVQAWACCGRRQLRPDMCRGHAWDAPSATACQRGSCCCNTLQEAAPACSAARIANHGNEDHFTDPKAGVISSHNKPASKHAPRRPR